jgi:hypothetical protein
MSSFGEFVGFVRNVEKRYFAGFFWYVGIIRLRIDGSSMKFWGEIGTTKSCMFRTVER